MENQAQHQQHQQQPKSRVSQQQQQSHISQQQKPSIQMHPSGPHLQNQGFPHPPAQFHQAPDYTSPYYPYPMFNVVPFPSHYMTPLGSQPQSSVPHHQSRNSNSTSSSVYQNHNPNSLGNSSLTTPNHNTTTTATATARVRKPAILKDPNTREVLDLPTRTESTKSTQPSSSAASSTKSPISSSSSSNQATISSSASSTPETSQILLQKIADVQTINDEDVVSDAVVTNEPIVNGKSPLGTPDEPTSNKTGDGVVKDKTETIVDGKSTDNLSDEPTSDIKKVEQEQEKQEEEEEEKQVDEKKEDEAEKEEEANENSETIVDGNPTEKGDEVPNKPNSAGDEVETKADQFAELTYSANQFHPINNRDGDRIYTIEFLMSVGQKLCNITRVDQSIPEGMGNRFDMFEPHFNKTSGPHDNDKSGKGMNGSNSNTRSNSGQHMPRKIIQHIPATQEVELKTANNPWRPVKDAKQDESELLKKKFRSILNKLTPNNFDSMSNSVLSLNIDSEDKLADVIDIVFAKALSEPGYCVIYGQMCCHLKKIHSGQSNFGNILLKRCQHQFHEDIYSGINLKEREEKIEQETDPDVQKQLCDELYEEKFKCRKRGLGLIKFIGELYKIDMLNDSIMMDCIWRLLQDTSEESLECLCDLLRTVGRKLDESCKSASQNNTGKKASVKQGSNKPTSYVEAAVSHSNAGQIDKKTSLPSLNPVFEELERLRRQKDGVPKYSLRIIFKIMDTIDLREKHNWDSKQSKDNDPKKIDEVREAHKEQLEQERTKAQQHINMSGPRGKFDPKRLGQGGGSSGHLSSQDRNYSRPGSGLHSSASTNSMRDSDLNGTECFNKVKKDFLSNHLSRMSNISNEDSLRPPSFKFHHNASRSSAAAAAAAASSTTTAATTNTTTTTSTTNTTS